MSSMAKLKPPRRRWARDPARREGSGQLPAHLRGHATQRHAAHGYVGAPDHPRTYEEMRAAVAALPAEFTFAGYNDPDDRPSAFRVVAGDVYPPMAGRVPQLLLVQRRVGGLWERWARMSPADIGRARFAGLGGLTRRERELADKRALSAKGRYAKTQARLTATGEDVPNLPADKFRGSALAAFFEGKVKDPAGRKANESDYPSQEYLAERERAANPTFGPSKDPAVGARIFARGAAEEERLADAAYIRKHAPALLPERATTRVLTPGEAAALRLASVGASTEELAAVKAGEFPLSARGRFAHEAAAPREALKAARARGIAAEPLGESSIEGTLKDYIAAAPKPPKLEEDSSGEVFEHGRYWTKAERAERDAKILARLRAK